MSVAFFNKFKNPNTSKVIVNDKVKNRPVNNNER